MNSRSFCRDHLLLLPPQLCRWRRRLLPLTQARHFGTTVGLFSVCPHVRRLSHRCKALGSDSHDLGDGVVASLLRPPRGITASSLGSCSQCLLHTEPVYMMLSPPRCSAKHATSARSCMVPHGPVNHMFKLLSLVSGPWEPGPNILPGFLFHSLSSTLHSNCFMEMLNSLSILCIFLILFDFLQFLKT